MHKFFCNYNQLTEKYELTKNGNSFFNSKINIQAENNLLDEIKTNIQALYELTVNLKEITTDSERLSKLDEIELLISNLYYSLFASPLELAQNSTNTMTEKELYIKSIELASNLEKQINIPEYNRLCYLIKSAFQNLNQM